MQMDLKPMQQAQQLWELVTQQDPMRSRGNQMKMTRWQVIMSCTQIKKTIRDGKKRLT